MLMSLRKGYALLVLALVLLTGLLGWTVKAEMSAPIFQHSTIHTVSSSPHVLCPPPPYTCQG